ncbi:MAG: CBS domain-containing protein [Planctomycetota bacterium]|nr:CBS domain-containing protein [Planctomycetota bacterium]
MYQVRDVINEDVITISADVTVEEAIRYLIDNRISGMPVVDEEGYLVGIISEFQLLETLYSPEVRGMPVRDVMTKDVLTVSANTMLSDAASLMVAHRIRRLPVVNNGKIVGIISRRDLLKYTLEAGDKLDEFLEEIKACVC